MVMKSVLKATFFSLAMLVLSSQANAGSPKALTDFNGDGKAELVLAEKGSTKFIWSVTNLAGDMSGFLYGNNTYDLIAGDYDGNGTMEPGIVRSVNGVLNWSKRYASGKSVSIGRWGLAGDRPISGDLDCDGKSDLIVARAVNGKLIWYIKRSSDNQTVQKTLGSSIAMPYAADIDGDSCDELVAVEKINGQLAWQWRNPTGNSKYRSYWGNEGDILLRPTDINGDNKADFLVVRNENGERKFYVKKNGVSSNNTLTARFGTISDTPTVGYFALIKKAQISVYRPSTGKLYAAKLDAKIVSIAGPTDAGSLLKSDGTLIQNSTIGDKASDVFKCDVEHTLAELTSHSFIWKPVSDGANYPRGLFLLPSYFGYISSADIMSNDGSIVAQANYAGYYGSRVKMFLNKTMSYLKPYSPLVVRFEYQNQNHCFRITDPTERVD